MLIRRLSYPAVMLLIVTGGGAALAEPDLEVPPPEQSAPPGWNGAPPPAADGAAPPPASDPQALAPEVAPPAPRPAISPFLPPPFFRPPTPEEQLHKAIERRNLGIGLIIVGNVLQFVGVSLLVPAVWHSSVHDRLFPAGEFAAGGGSLVGLGNVIEGFGWAFTIRGGRERDRLRRAGVEFAAVSALGRESGR